MSHFLGLTALLSTCRKKLLPVLRSIGRVRASLWAYASISIIFVVSFLSKDNGGAVDCSSSTMLRMGVAYLAGVTFGLYVQLWVVRKVKLAYFQFTHLPITGLFALMAGTIAGLPLDIENHIAYDRIKTHCLDAPSSTCQKAARRGRAALELFSEAEQAAIRKHLAENTKREPATWK